MDRGTISKIVFSAILVILFTVIYGSTILRSEPFFEALAWILFMLAAGAVIIFLFWLTHRPRTFESPAEQREYNLERARVLARRDHERREEHPREIRVIHERAQKLGTGLEMPLGRYLMGERPTRRRRNRY